jgi:hypothetical protein
MTTKNPNRQEMVFATKLPSAQHPNARLAFMRCHPCGNGYLAQTCDVHERRCPKCQDGEPANTFLPLVPA